MNQIFGPKTQCPGPSKVDVKLFLVKNEIQHALTLMGPISANFNQVAEAGRDVYSNLRLPTAFVIIVRNHLTNGWVTLSPLINSELGVILTST